MDDGKAEEGSASAEPDESGDEHAAACPSCGEPLIHDAHFCGRCGAARSEPPDVVSDRSGNDVLPGVLDESVPRRSREGWIVAGIVGAVVLVLGIIVATGGSDDENAAADNNDTLVDVTISARDACIDDAQAWLNDYIDSINTGDATFLYRRYGSQDPRTGAIVELNGRFQGELVQFGEAEANSRLLVRLGEYCDTYGDSK